MHTGPHFLTFLAAAAILAGCQSARDTTTNSGALDDVPLFTDLGSHHRAISTTVPDAQSYFDQGLRLTYAFNHEAAIRGFEQATRLDPDCAICYWGIAYAYGPNINAPMDSASGVLAFQAIQRASSLASNASEAERALIDALAIRYAEVPPPDRTSLDRDYAAAMKGVRDRFPDDPDVVTMHAEAVMNLTPWDYWTKEGRARDGMTDVLTDLERVLSVNPEHPGACHYYIHAVEAMHPARAVSCAERLASLMPGAGHLVHMPAHIYIRVGRWADAITANEHAVHSDEKYIADQRPTGLYPLAYYPHNYHFLAFAATMAGRADQAIGAARSMTEKVSVDVARAEPTIELLMPYLHLTLVTFGRWDDLLREPVPPRDLRLATALTQYARGVAFAATRDDAQARTALDTVRAIAAGVSDQLNRAILDIAAHALAGEIDFRGGDLPAAERHFRQAMALEDELPYMEPPHWYYPIRHSLGAVLMQQGRAGDAEQVYRQDLARFPENTWSLHGLRASLQEQGRSDDADQIAARIERLGSGIHLERSRFE